MTIFKTEKTHWINGLRHYASGKHVTLALSLFTYGIILSHTSNSNQFVKTGFGIMLFKFN